MPLVDAALLVVPIRLTIASVFLMAGWIKTSQTRAFEETIRTYRLLPRWLSAAIAKVLPWIEFGGGLALFLSFFATAVAASLLMLCLVFVAMTLLAKYKRLDLSCACFGLLYRERLGTKTLLRDGLLICFCLSVVLVGQESFAANLLISRWQEWPNLLVIFLTIGALGASVGAAYKGSRGNVLRWRLKRLEATAGHSFTA